MRNVSVADKLKHNAVTDGLVRRPLPFYGRFRKMLAQLDDATLEERDLFVRDAVQRVSRDVAATAYGRGKHGGSELQSWPLLEKEELRRFPQRFFKSGLLPVSTANTSGTTGTPLKLRRSWKSVVFEQAVLDHLASMRGVDWASARVAVLRGDTIKDPTDMSPPFWEERQVGRQLAMSCNHLNARTVDSYREVLEEFNPELLWVYPTGLDMLCGLSRKGDFLLPALKLVFSSSEVLGDGVRQSVRRLMNVPLCDFYGQAERVCASYSFDDAEHYFLAGYGAVELLYSYSDETSDFYEIIGTPFWNRAQPLMRYRTGDYARLDKGAGDDVIRAVCLGIAPFRGVAGRSSDYLVSPEGGHLMGIDHIPRGVPHIVQSQFVQSGSDVEIRVVPAEGFSEAVVQQIHRQARLKIPNSMTVRVETVDRLERTARGKAPFVIRRGAP